MIEIKNLTRKIKKRKILDIEFLKIKNGERIALVGANGSGKTTLFETILNLQKKTSGTIKFDFAYQHSPTEKIGVQFQDANYPIGISTRTIIDFFYQKTINPDKKYIDNILNKLKISDFFNIESSNLSGGQAQRLNIFLALINKPEILMLDELTTGLDVKGRNIIRQELDGYLKKYKNLTLILVTHIPMEIQQFCDRIVQLKDGKIVDDISKQKLLEKYKTIDNYLNKIE